MATIAYGLFGGFALGVTARAWMRLIAEDPEFTWGGTIFIVLAFTMFGLAQAVATLICRRARRRWPRSLARVVGAVGMAPLFGAAGAVMLPTVLGGALARYRAGWTPAVRVVLAILAAAPIVFLASELRSGFGWSLRSLAGFVGLLAIYGAIIWAARATFTPPAVRGRFERVAGVVGLLLLAVVATALVVGVMTSGPDS
jgi:hypothetical protein